MSFAVFQLNDKISALILINKWLLALFFLGGEGRKEY